MVLDVSAYSNIKLLENVHLDEDGDPVDDPVDDAGELVDYFRPCVNADYPSHAEGIEDRALYDYEEEFRFCAGSYSGYNTWRNCLAHFAGYESAKSVWDHPELVGPFVELIDFSDCEGAIGSSLSAKLAKDFADFNDRAKKTAAEYGGDWFYSLYQEWQKAFELAAQNGAISFH
jgi:hypothetical protein